MEYYCVMVTYLFVKSTCEVAGGGVVVVSSFTLVPCLVGGGDIVVSSATKIASTSYLLETI